MDIRCICFGVLFMFFGILFYFGKVHTRLDAWKSMSAGEKSAIRIKPLCRNIGFMIIVCGLIFIMSGLWPDFKKAAFIWIMIAWLILSGLDVYYIGKSKRYKLE